MKTLFEKTKLKVFEINRNTMRVYALYFEDEEYFRLKYDIPNTQFVIETGFIISAFPYNGVRKIIRLDIEDNKICKDIEAQIQHYFKIYPHELRQIKHKYLFKKSDY